MAFYLGRSLQVVGLLGVAYGFIVGVKYEGALSAELSHMVVGFAVFSVGTWVLRRQGG